MFKFNFKAKALLIAEAYSDAPEGQIRWTMWLLDDRLVEDTLLDEAPRWALKNEIKPRLRGEAHYEGQ